MSAHTARTSIALCGSLVAGIVLSGVSAGTQLRKPVAELTPVIEQQAIHPGRVVVLELKVELPEDIHVQSDEPRDPFLIPTILTFTLPEGVTVEEITYPPSTDFVQTGQEEPLAVFEHEFRIEVRLAVGGDVSPGELVVPGRFRYQACDDAVCFPPTTADVEWRLNVDAPERRGVASRARRCRWA